MRKLLLATAGVFAISAPAMASDPVDYLVAASLGLNISTVTLQNNTINGSNTAGMNNVANSNVGLNQISNNAGAGNVLQNSVAAAVIQGCGCADDLALSIAIGANFSSVNNSTGIQANTGATNAQMAGVANSNAGINQINQSAAANSILQNNVSVGYLRSN